MKKINLFWYIHPKGKGNFGDELNPYIISKISNQKVNHINLQYLLDNKFLALKITLVAVLQKRISLAVFFKYLSYNFFSHPKVLLAIGSVCKKSGTPSVRYGVPELSKKNIILKMLIFLPFAVDIHKKN